MVTFRLEMLAPGTLEAFKLQADFSARFDSPLYAELLTRAAEDIERGGPVARVLDGWVGNPVPDALVLRLMGGVHQLVLSGAEPQLARFYPSVGGEPQWPATWTAFLDVVERRVDLLRAALQRQVQTNEVRRCTALLAGFLTVSAAHALPLRLLEIGSSAGLNLGWDRYRYDVVLPDGTARHVWGDAASALSIRSAWRGALDVFGHNARVAERAGCDIAPVDVSDSAQARVLESFVWADQVERLRQLRAAIDLARRHPPNLLRSRAADFMADQLAATRGGVATVVFHSIMWWYLSEDERERVTASIRDAGARATPAAPVAWLCFEPLGSIEPDLRLTVWPGGEDRVLGQADPHGRYVHWAE